MSAVEALREKIPDSAKDFRINLQSVLQAESLNDVQRWGVAVACALATRNPELARAVLSDAKASATPEAIDDGKAAAALMGMNNVFYRFRHLMENPTYEQLPARLRMQRIAKPATDKASFELMCLAVSAINGCQMCMKAHEKVVLEGGLTEQAIFDAVRIASVLQGTAIGLEIAALDA